jgi:hypothetical protein
MNYRPHTKCYYVDNHERADVREARKLYIAAMEKYQLRMYKWIQLEKPDADKLKEQYPDMDKGYSYQDDNTSKYMVEFHVDAHDDFIPWRVQDPKSPYFKKYPITSIATKEQPLCMGGNLSVRFPAGERPMIHVGQDEAAYKAYILPKETWTIDGYQPLRPKEEGPAMMLSAFVGAPFFFGIPVPEWVIDKVNR